MDGITKYGKGSGAVDEWLLAVDEWPVTSVTLSHSACYYSQCKTLGPLYFNPKRHVCMYMCKLCLHFV